MPTDAGAADLVKAGKIRVAIFLPQYVKEADATVRGVGMGFVAIEIGRALAKRLSVDLELIENATPIEAMEGLKAGRSDFGCLGIDPSRTAQLDFTPAIVQFDYSLLVPPGSAIRTFADADRPGKRIAVVLNHASTFALTRTARDAELVGSELPDAAFALLRAGKVDAFAAPREQLLDYAEQLPGARVLAEGYGLNNAGIAIKKGQPERLALICDFVDEVRAKGLIDDIIARGKLRGFRTAPRT